MGGSCVYLVINIARWLNNDDDYDDAQIGPEVYLKNILLKVLSFAVRQKKKCASITNKMCFWTKIHSLLFFSQTSSEKVSIFREPNIGVVCLQHTPHTHIQVGWNLHAFLSTKIVSHVEKLWVWQQAAVQWNNNWHTHTHTHLSTFYLPLHFPLQLHILISV
jgi:hypothetical protein